jgi:predicted O-methyltransferase YrrM
MALDLPLDIDAIPGFLSHAEGELLHDCAAGLASSAPAVEIGSYCGKSTVYFGLGCRAAGRALFAVDHHRGSEEHQPGELFHDPALVDSDGAVDTLRRFRRTLAAADLETTVLPVLAASAQFATAWSAAIAMVFIDGGHSLAAALEDYRAWAGFIERGGLLAIHDIYPAPESGGQAPITILRLALASGLFREVARADSLRVLERL